MGTIVSEDNGENHTSEVTTSTDYAGKDTYLRLASVMHTGVCVRAYRWHEGRHGEPLQSSPRWQHP